MLDTNIVSDLIRDPHGRAALRLYEVGIDLVCMSIVTAAELWYGAMRKQSVRLIARVEDMSRTLAIAPFERPGERMYGALRADLTRRGATIGLNDLFIAAHALALETTLVTNNRSEFDRVPGLTVENWLA